MRTITARGLRGVHDVPAEIELLDDAGRVVLDHEVALLDQAQRE